MLHGDGVGEFDVEARCHQAIDQPVPVVGGFDDDAGEFVPMRGKQRQYLLQIVGTAFADQNLVGFVGHHNHAVV